MLMHISTKLKTGESMKLQMCVAAYTRGFCKQNHGRNKWKTATEAQFYQSQKSANFKCNLFVYEILTDMSCLLFRMFNRDYTAN